MQNFKKIFYYLHNNLILFFLFFCNLFFFKFCINKKKNNKFSLISINKNSGLGVATFALRDALETCGIKLNTFFISDKKNIINSSDINIFVGNPDILLPSFTKLFKFRLLKSYNIGYWFWELEKLPFCWYLSNSLVDEIWVNSDYIHKSFSKLPNIKIKKIPFYIDIDIKNILSKTNINFPRNKFTFCITFDFLSHFERKNPIGAIKAFILAFGNSNDVFLIIKSVNGCKRKKQMNIINDLIKNYSNMIFIDCYYPHIKTLSLIYHSDCYVSLHRAEGLGLSMAEAMYLGTPVIATNYSGNLEFMSSRLACLVNFKLKKLNKDDYIYSNNQFWADPCILHASKLMKKIKKDRSFRRNITLNAKKSIMENFSKQKFLEFCENVKNIK